VVVVLLVQIASSQMQVPSGGPADVLRWWLHAALLPDGEGEAGFRLLSSALLRCKAFGLDPDAPVRYFPYVLPEAFRFKLKAGHDAGLFPNSHQSLLPNI
jgi:hypothetical protein